MTKQRLYGKTKSETLYEAFKDIVPENCRRFSIIAEVGKPVILEMELFPSYKDMDSKIPNLKQLAFLEEECYNSGVTDDEGWP